MNYLNQMSNMNKELTFEDYCNQFTKEEVTKANEIADMVCPPQSRVFGNELPSALICALEMARWKNTQFETLTNSLPESLKHLITDLTI